jgi:hypothetical protein
MTTDPKWYDSTGATEISAEQAMTATAGIDSSPLTVQIINNKNGAGASDLVNAWLKFLFRDDGATAWVGAGDEWPDRHYLEVRRETGGWNTSFSQAGQRRGREAVDPRLDVAGCPGRRQGVDRPHRAELRPGD